MANVRDDGQKPHTRFSSWASRHNTSEAHRFGSRINAAFVHGKFTLLSGEICMSRGRSIVREGRNRFIRLTKNPAYPFAVNGYESLLRETQKIQRLMTNPEALRMATCGVSVQKSAEGILVLPVLDEGPNVEKREALLCARRRR